MKPNKKRIFLIVLDSFGIGELPDAEEYGDAGSNTLRSVSTSENFKLDNMRELGLGNIDGSCIPSVDTPKAIFARMAERSCGKDTTTGHWEIAGLISEKPFPTYPNGFPEEIISKFEKATGKNVLCNRPYSGTEVIKDYGREAIDSDSLIVYTSADSVFQIAAHEDYVSPEQLYEYCRIARDILCGEHSVGRVIARPFTGEYPKFVRTSNRHDFSLEPYGTTVLDLLSDNGFDTLAVGKINDIFAGRGISKHFYTSNNAEGMALTEKLASESFEGLCFVNLVDFDSSYGHRNDIDGYAAALTAFDIWLGKFIPLLQENDLLMITADHGCDPGYPTTDHTREYTPLLIFGKKIKPLNLGTRLSFADIGATVAAYFGIHGNISGKPIKINI